MDNWDFINSNHWYQANPEQIVFDGYFNEIRCLFGVSVSALNDLYNSEDSRASALVNFEENTDYFYELAVQAAEGYELDDEDEEIPPFFLIVL